MQAAVRRLAFDKARIVWGIDTATIYWEIPRFYEDVSISRVAAAAAKRGYPVKAAALSLMMSLAPRRIIVAGVCGPVRYPAQRQSAWGRPS